MFIRGWFGIEGRPEPRLDAGWPKIAAGYFKSVGIPLLAGREFTRAGHRTGAVRSAPAAAVSCDRSRHRS
jgi:hypothetical protein